MDQTLPRPRLPYAATLCLAWLLVGLLLTCCDRFFHVAFGVLAYRQPIVTGQAWWVFPGFVAAAAGMYLGARQFFAREIALPSRADIALGLVLFVAAYAASGVFLAWPHKLLIAFVVTWLLRVATSSNPAITFTFGLLLAVGGCVVEGLLMLTGDVAYRSPEIFHVPWWLAGLYLHGSFVVLQIVRYVETQYGRL